jgi:integrase
MANRRATLVRSLKLDGKWRYCAPFISTKGRNEKPRISPDYVVLEGKKFLVPMGTPSRWYVSWYEGTKKQWKRCENLAAAHIFQREQEARLHAVSAGVQVSTDATRTSLEAAAKDFLEEVRLRRLSRDSNDLYSITLDAFVKGCQHRSSDEVTRKDVLQYTNRLLESGLSGHTARNRFDVLMTFLRFCGVDTKKLVERKDRPKYEKGTPEAYTDEEIQALLKACKQERHALIFETLLKSGMRYRELSHLEWRNVSFESKLFHVRSKPEVGFKIKDAEERDIPVESGLLEKLKVWRKKNAKARFVFGTTGDMPDNHWLEVLKNTAQKAGLNCKHCATCKERNECERFFLHKFRATFMTRMLQSGMDLRTLMKLTGHSDLKSVERYLVAARGKVVHDKITAAFAGF